MILTDLTEIISLRFKALSQHESVRRAADAFSDTNLGLIIVCDEEQRAQGVVSKSDLVRHLAGAGALDIPVIGVMTRSIIFASPGDDLRATWKLMITRRLQNLPLLDFDRRPIGTLDIRDALQAILRLEEEQEGQLVNYIAGVGYR